MNKELAKIKSASLEIKDRGILNFWIHVEYENGLCQGVGGICLDEYDKEKKKRSGSAFGCEIIRRLLLEFDVNDFSEMKGKKCWVFGDGVGLSFTTKGISALKCDNAASKPVIWEEIIKEFE